MALGGLGVSLAGFAGLISALDRRPGAHSPVAAWRIRNVVIGGFTITGAGFGIVALYTLTGGDLPLTARLGSAALAISTLRPLLVEQRKGPAWPSERGRRAAIGGTLVLLATALGNVAVGGLGYLQLLLLLWLIGPISIFINTVRDVAAGARDPTPDSGGS